MIRALAVALCLPLCAQTPAKVDLLWQKLEAEVADEARKVDGVLGVALVDAKDGRGIYLHADQVFPAASTIKLALLIELYRQAQEGGKAKLADPYTLRAEDLVEDSYILQGLTPGISRLTNRDLATCMVAVSDNAAANILIDRLGMAQVNRTLDGAGLKETRLRRKMLDVAAAKAGRENTATPRELASLLGALQGGKLLNPSMTADLLSLLATPKDSPMPRLLPEGTKVANKPGSLDGVRADAGIVLLKDRPFILVVMGTYLRDVRAGEEAIARIARLAYRHFETLALSSELGRTMAPRSLP